MYRAESTILMKGDSIDIPIDPDAPNQAAEPPAPAARKPSKPLPQSPLARNPAPESYGAVSKKGLGFRDQVAAARKTGDQTSCCSYFIAYAANSALATVLIFIFLGLPVTMIVIGYFYREECPIEPMIPMFLLVGGGSLSTQIVLELIKRTYMACKNVMDDPCFIDTIVAMIGVFNVGWFIAGTVWMSTTYNYAMLYDRAHWPGYCDKTVHDFAFWVLMVFYIILWAALLCCCCIRVCMASLFDGICSKMFN